MLISFADPPEEPRPRVAYQKWYEEELKAPIEMANVAAEGTPICDPDLESKSIIMNLYLDCDPTTAGEIVRAANRNTRALCRLDDEIPSSKHLVIMQGPTNEVKKANWWMESLLKQYHKERTGLKPMHVLLEGVGSVEVCIIHVKTNPHSRQVEER